MGRGSWVETDYDSNPMAGITPGTKKHLDAIYEQVAAGKSRSEIIAENASGYAAVLLEREPHAYLRIAARNDAIEWLRAAGGLATLAASEQQ